MQPRKLNIGIVRFPYSGNGGGSAEHPDIGDWLMKVSIAAKADPRVSDVFYERFSDTPITMTRNAAIEWAKKAGVDVLIMVDSDQSPDMYVGVLDRAQPFFQTAFNHLYEHWEKGPVLLFAPYCGPPKHPTGGGFENPYVFHWERGHTGHIEWDMKMEAFSRTEAAVRSGIEEVAAGPTGLCMIDMRCFDYLKHPYFEYEWEGDGPNCPHCHQPQPGPRAQKASTEDVVFFRNLSLNVLEKLGYNPVLCCWDCWAGHHKSWCVGKPEEFKASQVHAQLRKAVLDNKQTGVVQKRVRKAANFPPPSNGHAEVAKTNGHAPKEPEKPVQAIHETDPFDLKVLAELAKVAASECKMRDIKMRIVELGSCEGGSAIAMAQAVEPMCDYEIHCIDWWKGGNVEQREKAANGDGIYETFKRNCGERFDKTIIPHRNTTLDEARWWGRIREPELRPIDLLFIDAGHSYEDCLADIKAWRSFVKPGGIICGHDYNCNFPGVKQAVHECFGWNVRVEGAVWYVQRSRGEWDGEEETLDAAQERAVREGAEGEGARQDPERGSGSGGPRGDANLRGCGSENGCASHGGPDYRGAGE